MTARTPSLTGLRRVLTTGLASAALLGTSLLVAPAASAYPSSCTIKQFTGPYGNPSVSAVCFAGGGSYRAVAVCKFPLWGTSTSYGRYVGQGQYSYAYCGPLQTVGSMYIAKNN